MSHCCCLGASRAIIYCRLYLPKTAQIKRKKKEKTGPAGFFCFVFWGNYDMMNHIHHRAVMITIEQEAEPGT